MMWTHRALLVTLLSLLILTGCSSPSPALSPTPPPPTPISQPASLATPRSPGERIPAWTEREALFTQVLVSAQPVLLWQGSLSAEQSQAQQIAVQHTVRERLTVDPVTQLPLRSEVMGVRPALPSDITSNAQQCQETTCYRVEIYNYSNNGTLIILVNLAAGAVVTAQYQFESQPEIPPYLGELAAEIAINAPEVIAALGFAPDAAAAGMPNVKTALNGSRCQRSQHLCVAPTFIVSGRALWAIVDLTEGTLVGLRWTDLGPTASQPITEQGLQNEVVMAHFCERNNILKQAEWEMQYILTSSDGLEIKNVRFQAQPVIRSAKLVDWHVSYSRTDGFGYSDATGCPMFSTASVVAFNGPTLKPIVQNGQEVGFALVQDFRSEQWPMACNYRYEQRYEFYHDGRFRVSGANHGQGCGNDGTYRPVVRLDFSGRELSLAQWDGTAWQTWTQEGWTLQETGTSYTDAGYQFRLQGVNGQGFYMQPNRGQFGDGSRGDFAYTYVSQHKPEEGDADMITIGPCCNEDFRQGPEKFITPAEPLGGTGLVLWYVAQMKNDDRPGQEYCWTLPVIESGLLRPQLHSCYFGPMFVPIP
ncbi:MAG: hypothetical protein KJ063_15145 [Anaerolineae bacterium]|nr:hypothetical protein [Anaerolineae bacterium]